MKFILSIDTEGDNQWDFGRELTVENIKFVPRLQNLCEKYFIKPTYLVTSEVCEDNFFNELLNQALKIKLPYIVMMFHSSELMPGCSKYRPDKDSIDRLYELLEIFFILLQNGKIDSTTLTEAAKNFKI